MIATSSLSVDQVPQRKPRDEPLWMVSAAPCSNRDSCLLYMCLVRTISPTQQLMETIPKPSILSRRVTAIDQGMSLADQMKLTGSRADICLYFDIVVSDEDPQAFPMSSR